MKRGEFSQSCGLQESNLPSMIRIQVESCKEGTN